MPDKEETAEQRLAHLEDMLSKVEALEDCLPKNAANPIVVAYKGLITTITDEMDKNVLIDYWEQRAQTLGGGRR